MNDLKRIPKIVGNYIDKCDAYLYIKYLWFGLLYIGTSELCLYTQWAN